MLRQRCSHVLSETASRLRLQTSELAQLFGRRLSLLRGIEDASKLVLNPPLQVMNAPRGNRAAGVDGSMDYDERLELMIFYVSAAVFCCPYSWVNGQVKFEMGSAYRSNSVSASAAVPLWAEDVHDVSSVDSSTHSGRTSWEPEVMMGLQRIPFSIMTMAELVCARRLFEDESVGIVFLDRPLSGTFLPLSRDLRLLLRNGDSALTRLATYNGSVSMLDLRLAGVLGPGNVYVPNRRPYTPYSALNIMLQRERKGLDTPTTELARALHLSDSELKRTLKALFKMDSENDGTLIEWSTPLAIKLRAEAANYWERVKAVCAQVVDKLFGNSEAHPLFISGDEWLTVLDLNSVNLFLMFDLVEASLRHKKLLLGITKDTSATEYIRAVLPYLGTRGSVSTSFKAPRLKSDTAFLTILSAANYDKISNPWRTHAYDSCFVTLSWKTAKAETEGATRAEKTPSLRASRKTVSREMLFVKGYFQLRSFKADSAARSPVFAYDRPYADDTDSTFVVNLRVTDFYGEVNITPFSEHGSKSETDDLVLRILAASDNPEVLEAFGHNQLLYLADKAVKAEVKLMRQTLRRVADLELAAFERKERIFMVTKRFRDFRSQMEQNRARYSHDQEA
jgi:hypothetical protein